MADAALAGEGAFGSWFAAGDLERVLAHALLLFVDAREFAVEPCEFSLARLDLFAQRSCVAGAGERAHAFVCARELVQPVRRFEPLLFEDGLSLLELALLEGEPGTVGEQ